MYCAEPTTGLDSFTSNEIISVVRSLALSGITVCSTIHSPTPFAFSQFDRLMLMLKGKVVYFGRNGAGAIEYLKQASQKFDQLIEPHFNSQAEWITDVIMTADREGYSKNLLEYYDSSEAHDHAMKELEIQLKDTANISSEFAAALAVKKSTTTPSWYALLILMKFRMLRNYCTGVFYASHAAPWIIQTLIIFSVFWYVADNLTKETVTNVVGILFFWCVTPAFGAASYIPSIMLSRPLYFRERNDGLYGPCTFLSYLMLEEAIIAVPVTLLINTIMWFGLKLAGSWVMWWFSFYITFIAGITVSYAICSVSPGIGVANAAVPIFGVFCLFFSGFLIRIQDIG